MPENAVIGAPEGARVPQGTSHKDFALFGAPSPLKPRARKRRGDTRLAPRGSMVNSLKFIYLSAADGGRDHAGPQHA